MAREEATTGQWLRSPRLQAHITEVGASGVKLDRASPLHASPV